MNMICFKCKKQFNTLQFLIKHLRLRHALSDGPHLKLQCSIKSCSLTFYTYSGFRKHVQKCANKNYNNVNPVLHRIHNKHDQRDDQTLNTQFNIAHTPNESISCENKLEFVIEKEYLDFLRTLSNLHLSQSAVQIVTENFKKMLSSVFDNCLHYLETNDLNFFSSVLKNYFVNIEAQLKNYNSIYKRKKVICRNTVIPREIAIGLRREKVFDPNLNIHKEVNIPCTFMYVPLLDTLKKLLDNESFFLYYKKIKHRHANILTDINDGIYFQTNELFKNDNNAFQIQLYYDDFETTNPLGSKTGAHKMGALYFTIRNLPPFLNSELKHIHLLALFYAIDLKNISFNEILQPIINDVKILETEGISCKGTIFYGTFCGISYDNLGGNQIHGMVESFSATHFCRICEVNKNLIQDIFSEKDSRIVLRTTSSYENHVLSATSDNIVFGIKNRIILNDLNYFKLFDVPNVDIMHDMLEGVVQYEIKVFIKILLNNKIANLNQINERIKFFNFGSINKNVKPSPIIVDKPGNLIGQRAAQCWVLVRYLPLILKDFLIDVEIKNKWKVIVLLLKIMSIVFAPVISLNNITELELLIQTHHTLFLKEFSTRLIPKHHMMIHYPTIIKNTGPLIYNWSMRFEAKHSYFKTLSYNVHNFKNICKTLTVRHEENMSLLWNEGDIGLKFTCGPNKCMSLNEYEHKNIITSNSDFDNTVIITSFKWIKFGYEYKHKYFIVSNTNLINNPDFEEIIDIIMVENTIFFITKSWLTEYFDETLHVYVLSPQACNDEYYNLVDFNLLYYKEPYEICRSFGKNIIVPKHIFVTKYT